MIPNPEAFSHETIFWMVSGASVIYLGIIGYLFKRIDNLKNEVTAMVPTKEEVKQISASLKVIATRLDSLYTLLAQRAIESIPKKDEHEREF